MLCLPLLPRMVLALVVFAAAKGWSTLARVAASWKGRRAEGRSCAWLSRGHARPAVARRGRSSVQELPRPRVYSRSHATHRSAAHPGDRRAPNRSEFLRF